MKTTRSKNATTKKQKQRLAFPVYDEENILNLDAVIVTPPPRQSGTLRVQLIYEEPTKPMPVEDPWEAQILDVIKNFRMMKRLSEEWGNREPRYEFHPLETKIIFDSPIQETTYIEIDDISEQLNERQRNAFFYVQRHGQITTREYVEINRVSRQTAHAELRDLTNKGLFTTTGKGRGTRYVQKVPD